MGIVKHNFSSTNALMSLSFPILGGESHDNRCVFGPRVVRVLKAQTANAHEEDTLTTTTGTAGQIDHTSPENSPYHRSLRAAVRNADQNEDVLRDILWLLNASDYLLDIRRIAANVLNLLPTLREITEQSCHEEEPELRLFEGWDTVLEWIRDCLPADICPETCGSTNPYFRNSFQRNPLWVDLWERVNSTGYRMLQAQFVFAHARYLNSASIHDIEFGRLAYEWYGGVELWQALPRSTYDAALRLRQLAEQEWSSMLVKLPETRAAFTYQEDISRTEFAANAKWEDGYRETIRSFLARANGFEEWSVRDLSEMTRRSRRPHLRTLATTCDTPGDPDDEFTGGWPDGSIVTVAPQLPEELVQEVISTGCDPDEFADETEIYVAPLALDYGAREQTNSTCESPRAHSSDAQRLAIQRAIAVRGQYRHIQMQHQLLPFEYNIPGAEEVRFLQTRLDSAWRGLGNSQQWEIKQRRMAELIALLKIQLWFGVSLKRAQTLVVTFTTGGQPSPTTGVDECKLIYDLTTGEWSIPIEMPPYRSEILDPAGQAHPQLKWVPVQDVSDVGRHIKALLENARSMNRRLGKAADEPAVLFPLDEQSYVQAARKFLKADESTRRITLRRLGGFVLNRMVSRTGDLMVGALITGRLGTLTRTERFYASYSAKELRDFYNRAASRMLEQVTARAAFERPLHRPEIWKGHAGARLCALDGEVEDAIRKLQERIVAAKETERDGVQYHNLLTQYSVLLFCFCTSCRPVRAPYLRLNRINKETGFAYLGDKDDDAHHKLRLIWVPELCQQQMLKYEQHCARMALHSGKIRDWPDPCFFLIKKREPTRVRLGTLPDGLERFLELPPNFYRAYLRHRLLEAGAPPEVVMCWLGHSFAGEEIWNVHSAMSAMEYRDCIASFLIPILEDDLKWKVM
jgi:hypothetical protein